MSSVALSSLTTSLARYRRSWGLWALLLVAPIGARYMLPLDGTGVIIAIGNHLPVMTSPFLGVSLGIVVSTLVLPIGWLYLRSNTTRRQPWQVEEVTAASRVAIALGRFVADVAVLLAMLAVLTFAGWFLGWLLLPPRDLSLWPITYALWLVAAPALMGLAALRVLFDARPLLRGPFGDFGFFCVWLTSIALPAAADHRAPGFVTNMFDFGGFVAPLTFGAPGRSDDFAIGGTDVLPGRVSLDVWAGLNSPGYLESRAAWALIAIAIVVIAGLLYRPHLARRRVSAPSRLTAWLRPGAPRAADANAPAAGNARSASLNLVVAEITLIGAGRAFLLMAAAIAVAGLFVNFRHAASPAAILLLIFALTAHAGRSEARRLLALTQVAYLGPMQRRAAFVIAGGAWSVLLALPALARAPSLEALGLAAGTGAAAALIATVLASVSGSGFAPRLVLLVLWYAYLSS